MFLLLEPTFLCRACSPGADSWYSVFQVIRERRFSRQLPHERDCARNSCLSQRSFARVSFSSSGFLRFVNMRHSSVFQTIRERRISRQLRHERQCTRYCCFSQRSFARVSFFFQERIPEIREHATLLCFQVIRERRILRQLLHQGEKYSVYYGFSQIFQWIFVPRTILSKWLLHQRECAPSFPSSTRVGVYELTIRTEIISL